MNKKSPLRESNIELLRLLAQFYILLYHILIHFVSPSTGDVFFKALQIPLHVGVVVFVLISGYFTIKPTSKGFVKLMGIFAFYSLPEVVYNICSARDFSTVLKSLLFFSNTHYWFIKTYVYLFLLAPMLNFFWNNSTNRKRIYVTLVLGFVAIYMPTVMGDQAMSSGKNLVNFMLIYYVGGLLQIYKESWEKISLGVYVVLYVALNIIIVGGYVTFHNGIIGKGLWHFCFPYSSMMLLINSILLFMLIGRFKFYSSTINYLATSSLAIYLIHSNKPYMNGYIGDCVKYIIGVSNSLPVQLVYYVGLALLTMAIAITIDKTLTPLWKFIRNVGDKLYLKLGF